MQPGFIFQVDRSIFWEFATAVCYAVKQTTFVLTANQLLGH